MAENGAGKTRRLRCVVYTRVSSDERLDQHFNSLHAQREACQAYIASQRHEGWHTLSAHYDDGGFSGGTMDRPALQRLLTDIAAGKIDIVVVYKLDRLTRSLFDFAKIVEALDAKGVSFVSVTQQFSTTTSMGRLTLNVLLSFAQFEREVGAERVRDKIAASKAKGLWMGGVVPLGYDAVNRKLSVNAGEAKIVRLLFDLYLRLGSVRQLQEECERCGLRTKQRITPDGSPSGGTTFGRGHLYSLLANPIYIGRVRHKDRSYEGEHEAIIDTETWNKVQTQLVTNAGRKRGRASASHPSLLAGLLFTAEGVPFTASHAVNHGRRYRYYVERSLVIPDTCKAKPRRHKPNGSENDLQAKGWRLPAHEIESLVRTQLAGLLRKRGALLDALRLKRKSPKLVSALLARAVELADGLELGSFASCLEIAFALVRRITIAQDGVTIEVHPDGLSKQLLGQGAPRSTANDRRPILIKVPVSFRRRGVEAKLIVLDQQRASAEPDVNLVRALVRAHYWFARIASGEAGGLSDIARAERLSRTYVTSFTYLAFLSPDITKVILEGRQPTALTTKRLISSAFEIPLLWAAQARLIEPSSS
jgi:DNA invertase Pin-like site-specific DNA recombinase